ncbi:MAG: hypothetical protein K1Y02_21300 [Candidatus Hydrogenedentes bacterium]|nr:hypothetical protein [Candidatus Hydrogenedentota bacterium]
MKTELTTCQRGSQLRALAVLGFVCILAVTAGAQAVPLKAVPDTVSFSSMDDTATIQVMSGDVPLAAEAVKNARIMIDNRDYSEQFIITRSKSGPASITIKPNPQTAQVGGFTLRIGTASGEVTAAVLTPFDKLPGMLENQAKAQGLTVDQLKAKLGMTQAFGRNTLSITLPEFVYEGYAFNVSLENGSDNEFTWTVDGSVALQGPGKSELSHVFEKSGDHVLSVVEKKGSGIVASWEGVLKVVAQAPLEWTVPAKTQITVPGPEGFKKYTWRVDGKEVSSDRVLKYSFAARGTSTIECMAEQPDQGNPNEFRRLKWSTTVK